MKGFVRKNQLLSLCGLNCGLCPMALGKYCGGCGQDNPSCSIARCSLAHRAVEYCHECGEYPCEKYRHFDDFDSFITHKRRKSDLMKAQSIGIDAYNREQTEKMRVLNDLLSNYNDGRRKSFFCMAVNLLELAELREAIGLIHENAGAPHLPLREKSLYAVKTLQDIAARRGVQLKLNRKK